MLHQFASRLREKHLPSMGNAHNASSVMHVQAYIAFKSKLWFASVQAHAHAHCHPIRPGLGEESTLSSYRCRDRFGGMSKGHEEGIALGVDLVSMILVER